MAAANPSPRRSDEPAAQGGEPPRRGTSHGVALAMAIGVTLLLLIGSWAFEFWMNDVERRPVVAPESSATGAVEEGQPQLQAAVDAPQPSADRKRDEEPANTDAAATPRASWRVRVAVVEIVDGSTAALAAAEVVIVLWTGDRQTSLARLSTDGAGVVEHDFTDAMVKLPASATRIATINAMASAPRHWSQGSHDDVPREGGLVALRVELLRGVAVRGR